MSDWWADMMASREQQGRDDAKKGVYDLPYIDPADDPQDDAENSAYARGWWAQRKMLGKDFEWRQ